MDRGFQLRCSYAPLQLLPLPALAQGCYCSASMKVMLPPTCVEPDGVTKVKSTRDGKGGKEHEQIS